jgi:hypothetical protein
VRAVGVEFTTNGLKNRQSPFLQVLGIQITSRDSMS